MEVNERSAVSDSLLKNISNWVATQAVRTVLQTGPRTQNLRLLDLSQGHCPPLYPMQRQAILVMWHEYIYLPIGLGFHSPVTLLVSQHRDANLLTTASAKMGFGIVRGSTTRGGSTALRKLKEVAAKNSIVITPDGPKGPRRQLNPGAVYLASLLQMPIVPVGVGCRNSWRLNTWDRFAIPKPGHRARIIFGPTIHVPRKCPRDVLDQYCQAVESDLNHVTHVAENWANADYEYPDTVRLGLRQPWVSARSHPSDLPAPDLNPACQTLARQHAPPTSGETLADDLSSPSGKYAA